MYLIFLLVTFVLIGGIVTLSGGNPIQFLDLPSLLVLLMLLISVLLSAGLLREFANAFRLVSSRKRECSLPELRLASSAVGLAVKTLTASGVLSALLGAIVILTTLRDFSTLGPNLVVAILAPAYSMVLILILLPLRSRIDKMIVNFMQE